MAQQFGFCPGIERVLAKLDKLALAELDTPRLTWKHRRS